VSEFLRASFSLDLVLLRLFGLVRLIALLLLVSDLLAFHFVYVYDYGF